MVNRIVILLVVCLVVASSIGFLYTYNEVKEVEDNMEEVYQGPVPRGYNLEHFRETGETIKEVEN